MHIPEAMTGRRLSAGRTESTRYGGAPEVASGSYRMSHGADVLQRADYPGDHRPLGDPAEYLRKIARGRRHHPPRHRWSNHHRLLLVLKPRNEERRFRP